MRLLVEGPWSESEVICMLVSSASSPQFGHVFLDGGSLFGSGGLLQVPHQRFDSAGYGHDFVCFTRGSALSMRVRVPYER